MVAYYVATNGKHRSGLERFLLDNLFEGNPVGLDEIKDATLEDILSLILKQQPEDRPSANKALKHPYLFSEKIKLERLRARRRGHRGVCTKFEKESVELLSQPPHDDLVDRSEIIAQQLQGKLKILRELDEEILNTCNVNEIQGSNNQATIEIVNEENVTSDNSTTTVQFKSNMPKLPKLELPKYGGKVTEWSSFWDLYDSTIHSNPKISNVKKFNYLKSLLEGNAARAIKGLTLTNANYDSAVIILNDRFGKTQQTIASHMDEI
ncbi:uncharacterized protein LOC124438651 [Xenia sp. Carnegie-2017]|uniref:uncharacterized protein LOC124438651 n=1 Tax=Xenia sp. Carnegie-2017 TaxID=2897299 RepID=UPI001F032F9A|nr:uncharacterized protein LOC124438651 [Xenia sp. Carnegie-2017]